MLKIKRRSVLSSFRCRSRQPAMLMNLNHTPEDFLEYYNDYKNWPVAEANYSFNEKRNESEPGKV